MKKQKFFGIISLILGIAMLAGCGVRMLLAAKSNEPLKAAFKPTIVESWAEIAKKFEEDVPLEQIDFSVFFNFGPQGREMLSMCSYHLHTTLRYYAHPGDLFPVLTVKAGTEVKPDAPLKENAPDASRWIYYGTDYSLPTYQSGWRYTRAYQFADQTAEPAFYYVRTEDLKNELLAQLNEMFATGDYSEERQNDWYRKSMNDDFYRLDNKFYQYGIYLSPDLLNPAWDGWNTALCAAGIALCLAGLVWLFYLRKRGENT